MIRSAAIRMKASRFHFVDERSMKDFSHTMVQLITSYVGYSNELRMSCDKESAIYDKLPIFPNEIDVADSSKEDIHPERMPSAQVRFLMIHTFTIISLTLSLSNWTLLFLCRTLILPPCTLVVFLQVRQPKSGLVIEIVGIL